MFRWNLVGTVLFLCGGILASSPLATSAADGNSASAASLGEPAAPPKVDKTPTKKPAAKPGAGTVIAPADSGAEPPPPAAGPRDSTIPGLQDFLRPDGFVIPGGVGSIHRGPDHIGIQINTPDGPLEINVPRRQRAAENAEEPPGPAVDGDAPPAAGRANVGSGRSSREFAAAARQFRAHNSPLALRRVNRYLERDAGDADLLQLRSLINFSTADYRAAYRDALTVLNDGDVWDWHMLRSLYRSADEYTPQYRALEEAVAANPNATEPAFLFAYHNLMLGNHDAARRDFGRVAALDATNETARRLANGVGPPQPRRSASPSPKTKPAAPASPPKVGTSSGQSLDLGQPAPPAEPPKEAPKAIP